MGADKHIIVCYDSHVITSFRLARPPNKTQDYSSVSSLTENAAIDLDTITLQATENWKLFREILFREIRCQDVLGML